MSLQIDTANSIIIDGRDTGLRIRQAAERTVIYTPETRSQAYREHEMPRPRYATSHDAPASGVAGRAQLESDLRALIARL